MPEYLRALAVIIVLSLPVFWLGRKPMCELAIAEDDFVRRRNLWLFITVLAFLSHNFWVYAFIAGVVLAIAGTRDSNRLGLYLFLLFAVPPFEKQIPGFGGINYLIDVTHPRLLSFVILLPAYLSLRREESNVPFGRTWADRGLLGYMLLQLGLQVAVDTATNTMRSGLYAFIDVFLPYYVASRGLRDLRAFRDAAMSLVMAALLMAPVAAFEYLKYWLLYSPLPGAMGVPFGFGNYLSRGDSLRALASTGHSIVLGYVMMIALSLFSFAQRSIDNRKMVLLGLAGLLAGLVTPVARGPWVGAAVGIAVLLLTGPHKMKRIARAAAIGLPVFGVLLLTPVGSKIIDLIPFVGTVDDFNVVYRQRLFQVSMDVFWLHPVFGSFDYLSTPAMQEMIQGEGIIDMVNSYLAVAMTYGAAGLALFVGVFASAAWSVWRCLRMVEPGSELEALGRALLAALAGTLVTIATLSSILVVPVLYWTIAGLCVGYVRLVAHRGEVPSPAFAFEPWSPPRGRRP